VASYRIVCLRVSTHLTTQFMAHIRLQDRHTHEQMFTNKDLLVHQSSADAIRRATITHRNTRTHTYSLSLSRAHVRTCTRTHTTFLVYTHQHTTRAHALTYVHTHSIAHSLSHTHTPDCSKLQAHAIQLCAHAIESAHGCLHRRRNLHWAPGH